MNLLIAPLEALTDSRLSDPERRVLLALYSFKNKNSDTVWPSVEGIAERSHINDRTRISKITGALVEKGWVTKKKRGFTGGNEYTLIVPSNLAPDTTLDQKAKMDSDTTSNLDCNTTSNVAPDTTLDQKAKMDSDTTSNLDCNTTSNVAPDTTYKEQYIEQSIEQEKENINICEMDCEANLAPDTTLEESEVKTKNDLDYSSWPEMPSPQVFADWKSMRKRLKADVSQTVIDRFAKQLRIAMGQGVSVDECLGICVTQNWRGFEFEWIQNRSLAGQVAKLPVRKTAANLNFTAADYSRGINADGSF